MHILEIDTLLAFVVGIALTLIIVRLYFNRAMYGGELYVDRTYKRPDIYLDLDRRYANPADVAKQRYILLRVRTVRYDRTDADEGRSANPQNNHAL